MSGERAQTRVVDVVRALAPLTAVAGTLVAFANDPYGFVAGIISRYIINTVLGFGAWVVNSILMAFDLIVGSFVFARDLLVGSFAAVGINILGVVRSVQQQIGEVVMMAGPLGPPLAVLFASVTIYVTFRIGVALLGEIPIGSSIVDLLGLR